MDSWMRCSACALLLAFSALAQAAPSEPLLNERLTVQAIHFVAAEEGYRVSVREKAALLLATPNVLPCLVASQRLQKPVDVEFEAFSLRVLNCQPAAKSAASI
ncbi:hypothetical protein CK507_01295 [Pseudomonas sp. WN033]|nr:hypothetical protein CK507_01295 [Pseudomonas sp. WN033]